MKQNLQLKIYAFLVLCFFNIENSMAQWTDNFSDGDFTSNPAWFGDTSKFVIDASAMLQLWSAGNITPVQLATVSTVSVNAEWDFKVIFKFNPSSGNYAKIYIMSDTSVFTGEVNGYFVRVGYTNDDVSLIKQSGTSTEIIIDGRDKMLNSSLVDAAIKVTRDSAGNWALYCDSTGSKNYIQLGTVKDNTFLESKYFGVQCIFTSTRAEAIYFDDFIVTGTAYKDPYIYPQMYDVVFNEIMADPSPADGLPEYEYIELYNRSSKNFYLKNWELLIGDNSYYLPDTILKSGCYLVLTASEAVNQFYKWCKPVGILPASQGLTNSGAYLALIDKYKTLVSWLNYSCTWYNDDYKAEGGWSLEQIDPENLCGGINNWKASINTTGGTPGFANSVFQSNLDTVAPELLHLNVLGDSLVQLYFNEPLQNEASIANHFLIKENNENPYSVEFLKEDYSALNLNFKTPLTEEKTYHLTILKETGDCVSNFLETDIDTLIGIPGATDSSDIIINEILFNSEAYCPEFIEIYNNSRKILSTSDMLLYATDGTTEKTNRISGEDYLFYPGTFLLLSSDCKTLTDYYKTGPKNTWIDIYNWKALDDNSGTIKIMTTQYKTIDQFAYSDEMHLATLTTKEGVSLEKITPSAQTNLAYNWHSAAETAGYATPGCTNSHYIPNQTSDKTITIENELFSPDNDGYNDLLTINYSIPDPDSRVSIQIFDLTGRRVRNLCSNVLIGTTGAFYWDGFSDSNKKAYPGAYVVWISLVNSNGTSKNYKYPCVVALKN
jgi:hypothetical protein